MFVCSFFYLRDSLQQDPFIHLFQRALKLFFFTSIEKLSLPSRICSINARMSASPYDIYGSVKDEWGKKFATVFLLSRFIHSLFIFAQLNALKGAERIDTLITIVTWIWIKQALVDVWNGGRSLDEWTNESKKWKSVDWFWNDIRNKSQQIKLQIENEIYIKWKEKIKVHQPSHNFFSSWNFSPGRHLSPILSIFSWHL